MSHTPGPWIALPPDDSCGRWFIGRDRFGAPVGIVPDHLKDGRAYYIAVFGNLMPNDDAEANARLIAAAPDLLEVARMLASLESDDHGLSFPSKAMTAAARAAIAKAEAVE